MGDIYITGDTHGRIDIAKLKLFDKPCDYMIIAGDFGVPFEAYKQSNGEWIWGNKYLQLKDFYDSRPYKVLFIDGNHENFDYLDSLPEVELFNGKVNIISPNIIHLKRGEVYTINNKTIWTFGGATSIDRFNRVEGYSWWRQEIPSYTEMNYGIDKLESVNNKIDYIITHTPPNKIIARLHNIFKLNCPVANYLDNILEIATYDKWYCGHMHRDIEFEELKIQLLYNDIVKIK